MQTFEQFYQEIYRHEHHNPINRWIHFLSNLLILVNLSLALLLWDWRFLPVALFFQLVPPYLGHLVFEGNHEAAAVSPLWSAMGNWRMFFDIIRGREKV
jgi:hypothetical protein